MFHVCQDSYSFSSILESNIWSNICRYKNLWKSNDHSEFICFVGLPNWTWSIWQASGLEKEMERVSLRKRETLLRLLYGLRWYNMGLESSLVLTCWQSHLRALYLLEILFIFMHGFSPYNKRKTEFSWCVCIMPYAMLCTWTEVVGLGTWWFTFHIWERTSLYIWL